MVKELRHKETVTFVEDLGSSRETSTTFAVTVVEASYHGNPGNGFLQENSGIFGQSHVDISVLCSMSWKASLWIRDNKSSIDLPSTRT
ncbi:hypothetical protein GOP47_0007758 [Adiantum capillus-veneris]|uniref:Uncharacterized protein n=1 Tax=Adiantum capillus-veneris TaxID=13818 RepID=A0A9D4ZJL6_ADICA|nr:hypothetical protein GOP47_0007758 [Adiantum capillus-veneris]